jgi:hypothetical protein
MKNGAATQHSTFNDLCSNHLDHNASIFQLFYVSICLDCTGAQLFECECVQEEYHFWVGYFIIYSSLTKGKAVARRQSEAIALARHANNAVESSALPLSYISKIEVEIYSR